MVAEFNAEQVKVLQCSVYCNCLAQVVDAFVTQPIHADSKHFEILVGSQRSAESLNVSALYRSPLQRKVLELSTAGQNLRKGICSNFANKIKVKSENSYACWYRRINFKLRC